MTRRPSWYFSPLSLQNIHFTFPPETRPERDRDFLETTDFDRRLWLITSSVITRSPRSLRRVREKGAEIVERAEVRIDVQIIGDVVAVVLQGADG